MEQHGQKPNHNIVAIIPARYESTRLPGKLLCPIAGKPLILHTLARAESSHLISKVIVATDDVRIFDLVTKNGGHAVMTSADHQSGSDRIAEVAEALPEGSIIVNVQGDEPLIEPETIDSAINALLNDEHAVMATTCSRLADLHGELLNGNVVKVVVGDNGYAMHFSRSPIPFPRDASLRYGGDPGRALENEPSLMSIFKKHTGLYVYRREYLLRFTKLQQTTLEKIESLEQLRALEDGAKIRVVETTDTSIGVDTQEDLDNVRLRLEFPDIRVCVGTKEDTPKISETYVRSVRGSYSDVLPSEYLESLTVDSRAAVFERRRADNQTYGLLIAEHEIDGVVAMIDYSARDRSQYDHEAHIFSFYVVPEYQRCGLGGILFRKCLRTLRSEGCGSVWLDTFATNPFRGFYDKLGGRVIASPDEHNDDRALPSIVYGWSDLSNICATGSASHS